MAGDRRDWRRTAGTGGSSMEGCGGSAGPWKGLQQLALGTGCPRDGCASGKGACGSLQQLALSARGHRDGPQVVGGLQETSAAGTRCWRLQGWLHKWQGPCRGLQLLVLGSEGHREGCRGSKGVAQGWWPVGQPGGREGTSSWSYLLISPLSEKSS